MKRFSVEFYETPEGKKPVEESLNQLDRKMRVKTVAFLELLEEKGSELREPYSKHLEDGIYELRIQQGGNAARVLYFFFIENRIVVTNAFVKKSQKTPRKEITLAKKRREEYRKRGKQ